MFRNGSSKICGRQPSQILLGPFLNTLLQMKNVQKICTCISLSKYSFKKGFIGQANQIIGEKGLMLMIYWARKTDRIIYKEEVKTAMTFEHISHTVVASKAYVKVGLSPSKNFFYYYCFNDSPSKIIKNSFYFISKAFFVKMIKLLSWM